MIETCRFLVKSIKFANYIFLAMNEKIKSALRIVVFFAIGAGLFWWVYKDQNFDHIGQQLKNIDYKWIWLSVFFSILSHISRAIRWNILLEPLGYKPKLQNTFFAVMIMYLANLAVPRMGEVTRCGIMKKYEKVPITESFGTVFTERLIDLIMLLLLLVVVLLTQYHVVIDFVNNNPQLSQKVSGLNKYLWVLYAGTILFVGALVLWWILRHYLEKYRLYIKMKELALKFIEGIKTILKLKRAGAFIIHSIFIYLMYFLMIYVNFFAFESTQHLGIMAGITAFVLASFGMVAPVQGGIGAWHFMVIQTLFIYGVSNEDAGIFALVVHGVMTLLLMVLGAISVVAIPVFNKNKTALDKV